MKDVCMNNKSKLSFTSKVLLGLLAIVVITGLGAVAYAAAPESTDNQSVLLSAQPIRLFNPFTLQREPVSVTPRGNSEKEEEGQGMSVGSILLANLRGSPRPPIRIPYRPALRSPYRPPL